MLRVLEWLIRFGQFAASKSRDSAGSCRLRTMSKYRMRDERMRSQPLQADFAIALAHNPDDAELGFHLTHLDVENFTGSNLPPHALHHQAPDAHVCYQGGLAKWLTVGIHSPNLDRELNVNSWALASIHEGIVRYQRPHENLLGLPPPEYWSLRSTP